MSSEHFELRLSSQLRRLADAGVRPVDPMEAAVSAVAVYDRGAFGLRRLWRTSPTVVRIAWLAALLALLIIALITALVIGVRPRFVAEPPLQQIALVRGGNLLVGNTRDEGATQIATRPSGSATGSALDFKAATWSPDGQNVAAPVAPFEDQLYGSHPYDQWLTSFASGLIVIDKAGVTIGRVATPALPAWSADGRQLLAVPLTVPDQADLSAIDAQLITLPQFETKSLAVGQVGLPIAARSRGDGNFILVLNNLVADPAAAGSYEPDPLGTASIWLVDPTGARPAAMLGHFALGQEHVVAIRPDGEAIAVVATDPFHTPSELVYVLGLDGTQTCSAQLAGQQSDLSSDPAVAWSADGANLAVALTRVAGSDAVLGPFQPELWTVGGDCSGAEKLVQGESTDREVDGAMGNAVTVLSGEAVDGPLIWSSDGRWLYYRGITVAGQTAAGANPFDLRRISAGGGASQLVATAVEWFDLTGGSK